MEKLKNNLELTPLAAAVAEDIRNFQMIRPGDRVIVGLSGGPDSVCLLSLLAELRPVLEIRGLHAVHVNHGLRGVESDRDQEYAEEIARQLDATFDAVCADVRKLAEEQGTGEEEAGRKLRYSVFEMYRQRYGAHRIAVAHNRNDQAETVMMRLIRGTGLRGLSGIDRVRSDGIVIRPLLGVCRENIEEYCRTKNLTPRLDSTNLKAVYTRNRLRLNLIPLIESEYNPRLQDALIRLAEQAEETEDFLRQTAIRYLDENRDGGQAARWNEEESFLNPDGFEQLHRAVAGRVMLELLERIGAAENVTSDTISRMIQVAHSSKEPLETDLQNGYYLRKMYGKLWFLKRVSEFSLTIEEPVPLPVETLEALGSAEVQAGSTRIRLSVTSRGSRNGKAVRSERKLMQTQGKAAAVFSGGEDHAAKLSRCVVSGKTCVEPPQTKKKNVRAALDLDRLLTDGVPVFRNRRPGDRFRPIGMAGRKKIQDFLTDRKIPRQDRDQVILLALGHEVFLANGEVSGNCAVTKETQRVLKIEYPVC